MMFNKDFQEAVKSAAWRYNIDPDELHQDMALALLDKGFTKQTLAAKGGRLYLFKMAQNRAHNIKKKNGRSLSADMSETGDDPGELGTILTETTDGSIGSPEHEYHIKQTMDTIREHVRATILASKYPKVLEQYYLLGKDFRGVSEALGLGQSNVRKRLMLARRELGELEGDLRIWRAYAYPEVRQPDGKAVASEALLTKVQL